MGRSTVGRSISSNLWAKVMGVIVIILFVAGFRSLITTDEHFARGFAAMMSTLPFADELVDVMYNMLDYHRQYPELTPCSFLTDLLKLVVMSCVRGPVIKLASNIFNPPQGERQVRSPIKQMVISLVLTPILAIFSSWAISSAAQKMEDTFGPVLTSIISLLIIVLLAFVSVFLFKALSTVAVSFGLAMAYRFLFTFGVEMAANFLLSMICLALYVAVVVGNDSMMLTWGFALLIYLAIMGVCLDYFRRSVVRTFR